jgi:hypothetical protein
MPLIRRLGRLHEVWLSADLVSEHTIYLNASSDFVVLQN